MAYGIYENGKVIAQFVTPLTIKSNQPIFVSDTLSLKRQVSKRAAQRWEITTNLEPLAYDAQDLFVNLVTKGYSETVTIIVPQNNGSKRTTILTAGSGLVTGSVSASQLSLTGMVGKISKGTFIKFANHNKVYMVTSDCIPTSTGTAYPLNIFPTLRVSITSIVVSFRDDVIMNCMYDTDAVSGMSYTDGVLMDMGTIKLIERL